MPKMTFPTLEVLLMLVKKGKVANYGQCVLHTYEKIN